MNCLGRASVTVAVSPSLGIVPRVDIVTDLILCETITLLDLAFELFAASVDHVKVVIREFSPLLLDSALDLFPASFHTIPVQIHLHE